MSMSIKNFDFTEIQRSFPTVNFGFYISEDQSFISCILCEFETAQSLIEQWEAIQNFVSVFHQPQAEAERWNVYLMLLCAETINIRNKYIIQNDTYVARKVVVENESVPVEGSRIIEILNNELLGFDLKFDFNRVAVECNYQSSITDLLVDTPLDASVGARSIREKKIKTLVDYISSKS